MMMKKPQNVFLIDAVGAAMSAISTGILLPQFDQWTGIPHSVSFPLSVLGVLYAVFSASCFLFLKQMISSMLAAIIVANSIYFAIALFLGLALDEITLWGRLFLFAEALILFGMIFFEMVIYSNLLKSEKL